MYYPIITSDSESTLTEFISFWSKQYFYQKFEDKYTKNIVKPKFDTQSLIELFEWKNDMRLSGKKLKSLNSKIIAKYEIINKFKQEVSFNIEEFRNEFQDLSAVWKIFLLHIIKPNVYPIYDQHVHRTYLYIHSKDWGNISNNTISNKEKELFYFDSYFKFIQGIEIENLKKLDEAFFAFGQFLKTRKYAELLG